MRGKYSPTVSAAYQADKKWFKKYSDYDSQPDNWFIYDPDGFDSYGYDENEIDRAGNREDDYYSNDDAYDAALSDWGFDGTKPVQRG